MIQNRQVRLFLLTLSLVFPGFSPRVQAEVTAQASAHTASENTETLRLSNVELQALHLAFRGFVAVTLPGGVLNGCEGREASDFVRRHHEFYRSWYSVTIEAVCIGRPVQTAEVWFICSDRNTFTCSPSQPFEEAPATLPQN